MNISNRDEIELKNKNIIVIGLGKSGCGAAKLAHYLKANVFVSDQ
jgi:UDP-N-acetylmuramoylalanine-D-glutamate ligase